ncbi:hypothetical protein [Nonomuraea salmonea]|uniref:Uncharacterized protein n=1 Tax=Nonomuraea salmonea TaxID=46181 RepID=A0ABV5P2U1_9ACTN
MTRRSQQMRRLAAALTMRALVPVRMRWHQARWVVSWMDGPTQPEMEQMLQRELRGPFGEYDYSAIVRGHPVEIGYQRDASALSWPMRAVAAVRDGRLAALGEPDADAVYEFVQELVDATAFPDRPSHPGDEAACLELVLAVGGWTREMARLLAGRLAVPAPDTTSGERRSR